jgi:Tfp pilus assembly protein PilO
MKKAWRTPLIVGVVGAILVLAIVAALILPKASQVRTTNGKLAKASAAELGLEVRLEALKGAQKEAPANRRRLAKLQSEVPETVQLPSVIRLLNATAEDSAVDFISVSPSTPALSLTGNVSTLSTQIQVNGSYFAVDEFLFRLESLLRVAKVTQISLAPQGEHPGTLQASLTAEFYTTDLSSGPGSDPGHSATSTLGVVTTGPSPSPTPTPTPTQGG